MGVCMTCHDEMLTVSRVQEIELQLNINKSIVDSRSRCLRASEGWGERLLDMVEWGYTSWPSVFIAKVLPWLCNPLWLRESILQRSFVLARSPLKYFLPVRACKAILFIRECGARGPWRRRGWHKQVGFGKERKVHGRRKGLTGTGYSYSIILLSKCPGQIPLS